MSGAARMCCELSSENVEQPSSLYWLSDALHQRRQYATAVRQRGWHEQAGTCTRAGVGGAATDNGVT